MPKPQPSELDLADLLVSASKAETLVDRHLDETKADCTSCGSTHYTSWQQHQAAQLLRAAAKRLRDAVQLLRQESMSQAPTKALGRGPG